MNSFEKKMLVKILKTIQECDSRLKDLEAQFYHEPTIEDIDQFVYEEQTKFHQAIERIPHGLVL